MFTGIVEDVGTALDLTPTPSGARLTVATTVARELSLGESIAVDGVCLTVVEQRPDAFAADLSPTTLELTTLGALGPGAPVNLERALRVGDRLSGHWVTGHVDEVGEVVGVEPDAEVRYLHVAVPASSRSLLVPRGSVALAGISLTIVAVTEAGFTVTVIPHTLRVTSLGSIGPGERVNVEYDIVGKYVRQLLQEMKGVPWT